MTGTGWTRSKAPSNWDDEGHNSPCLILRTISTQNWWPSKIGRTGKRFINLPITIWMKRKRWLPCCREGVCSKGNGWCHAAKSVVCWEIALETSPCGIAGVIACWTEGWVGPYIPTLSLLSSLEQRASWTVSVSKYLPGALLFLLPLPITACWSDSEFISDCRVAWFSFDRIRIRIWKTKEINY